MDSLRFVDLSDDGACLIVKNTDGASFSVPITDELRVAMVRRAQSPSQAQKSALSPKDIQTKIRQGATSEELAAQTGLPLERIESYAAPVRAEREFAASSARGTEISDRTLTRDALRAVFGEGRVTLEDMVRHRAALTGIDVDSLRWDAWRRPDSSWDVSLRFELSDSSCLKDSELAQMENEALWVFQPSRKFVSNANRWAQLLSELEPLESADPPRRLSAVRSTHDQRSLPADASSEDSQQLPPPVRGVSSVPGSSENSAGSDQDSDADLLDMLHERRGTRLGTDEKSDDRLALMISQRQQAARDRRESSPSEASTPEREDARRREELASTSTDPRDTEETMEITKISRSDQNPAKKTLKKKSSKDKRSRIPSWDQIYFGAKPDEDR